MFELSLGAALVFAGLLFLVGRRFFRLGATSIRDPPGPKPLWLVGNTFQIPKIKLWKYFANLAKEHGPIVKLSLAGDDLLVLHEGHDAEELLGRRSHNYSSRKQLVYGGKYLSQNRRLVLLPYGSQLKKHRQAFHQMLQPRVLGAYEAQQLLASSKLLYDMLLNPADAFINCKRFSASLVFGMTYGRPLSADDADLHKIVSILDNGISDLNPGTHIVDTFPILDSWWIPGWIATWRAEATRKYENDVAFYLRLLNEVKSRMDSGEPNLECFAARLWEQQEKLGLDPKSMAYVAGAAFEAGTGSPSGTLLFFLMAMILHPQVAKRAQDELDAVVGDDGPPTFEHMKNLPYCIALCKEVFRWSPTSPTGFPHFSEEDDTYKGYNIRGKTIVMPNVWAMHRDPKVFPDPTEFRPERWGNLCEPDSLIEGHWSFGFGRRACPGRHLGSKTVWIGMTQVLWGFDIRHRDNAQGNPIAIDTEAVTSGVNIEPIPFELSITPRSVKHAERIRHLWAENEARTRLS